MITPCAFLSHRRRVSCQIYGKNGQLRSWHNSAHKTCLLGIDNIIGLLDLKALRQYIWERNGDRTLEVDCSCGDYPRWIDTSVMLADPLTKAMKTDRLDETLRTGRFDLRPTAESLMIKERNRACRKAATLKKKSSWAIHNPYVTTCNFISVSIFVDHRQVTWYVIPAPSDRLLVYRSVWPQERPFSVQ